MDQRDRVNEALDNQRVLREATLSLQDKAAEATRQSIELHARFDALRAEVRLLQDDYAQLRDAYVSHLPLSLPDLPIGPEARS